MNLTTQEKQYIREIFGFSQAERDKAAIQTADKEIAAKKQGFANSSDQSQYNKANLRSKMAGATGTAYGLHNRPIDPAAARIKAGADARLAAMNARDNSISSQVSRGISKVVPTAAQGAVRTATNAVGSGIKTASNYLSPKLGQAQNFIKSKLG